MKKIALGLIKFYKVFLSKPLTSVFGGGCRFTPTCSEYAYDAFEKHGVFRGFFLTSKRILRCNGMSAVKFDPVS